MKKTFIILFALVLSLIVSEFIIGNILSYPKRVGQRKFVYATNIYNNEILKWKNPFTKYWTVEGGNKVYSYNNLGFPGTDVNINDSSETIFMLGDSFLEAMQVSPDKMAVSVFADLAKNTNLKPINLGSPNNDAYILWFRANFYEKYFKPSYVCLTVTCLEVLKLNFNNHTYPFKFSLPENFGNQVNDSRIERFANVFRNNLAFVNLLANGINNYSTNTKYAPKLLPELSGSKDYHHVLENLKECLVKYKNKYGDNFFVVSMEPEETNNVLLSSICDSLKINYSRKNLLVEENIIKGGSHLNELGNQKLGELFYDTFIKFYKK